MLSHAFTAWLEFQQHRQSKQCQQEQLNAVRAFWQRKQAWEAWRGDFMPAAREQSNAVNKAKQHRQANVLSSTLCAWAEVIS